MRKAVTLRLQQLESATCMGLAKQESADMSSRSQELFVGLDSDIG